MKNLKTIAIINAISLLVALVINYLSTAAEIFGISMKEMSDKYANLFTPATYAFSIWGFIYLFLIAFVIYQFYQIKNQKYDGSIEQSSPYFAIANFANAAWVVLFLNDQLILSMLIMVIVFFSLLKATLAANLERWDAPAKTIAFVWWPISFYFGWITVAAIANASALLVKLGYDGSPIGAESWTILLMIIATIIYLLMIYKRNMREYALVGIWALIAIAVKNWETGNSISYWAIGLSLILFIYISIHGFKNRKSNPFFKPFI